jgi:DNA polymerase-3 subunit beta
MEKFQVNGKKLLELLTKAMKIIQPKSPIPMYSSGLLEIKDNILHITVTDMDHTLITHMNVEGDNTNFIVKIQDLFEIIKKVSGTITFYKDKNKIIIETENSHIELFLIEEAFIKVNMDNVRHIITINNENFIKLFNFFPITTEEWNFIFRINNNQMDVMASDRKRLVFSQIFMDGVNSEYFSISYKTLTLLLRYVTGNIEIYQKNSQLIFKFIDGIFWSKLSNGPNINYQRILQKKNDGLKVLVNKKNFLGALNRVSLLASNISKVIKLIFYENKLTLYASDASRGQAEEHLIVEGNINGCLFMNCEFLISAIKTIESNNIEIFYTGEVSHFFISSHNEICSIIHVIMPIVMNH